MLPLSLYGPGESMAKQRELVTNREWCKGCNICVAFCPKAVLELDDQLKIVVARPDDCIWCRECEIHCPDMAITIEERAS